MAKLTTILDAHANPGVVSASQLPVLAGLVPASWGTPLDLYLEKTGLKTRDEAGEAAYWGSKLEPLLLAEYAKREQLHVLGQNEQEEPVLFLPNGKVMSHRTKYFKDWVDLEIEDLITNTVRHPTLPIITHLDGVGLLTPCNVVTQVQAKTAGAWKRDEWGEVGTDQMPPPYLLQVQTEMMCLAAILGRSVPSHVPVLLGGQEFRQYEARLDERVSELIADLATDFVNRVANEEPPPPTPDKAGTKALQVLHPGNVEGEELVAEAGTQLAEAAQRVFRAKLEVKAAEAELDAASAVLQAIMGDATKLIHEAGTVSWTPSKPRTTTSWKKVAEVWQEADPDAYNEAFANNTKTAPGPRSFRVTPKEAKS